MRETESAAAPADRASRKWLCGAMSLLFVLQVALYSESSSVGPAGDDFNAPLADIWRGTIEGPWALLARSAQPHNYRPLQSLAMWAFGSISTEHRLFWIHALGFAGMAVFALGGALWIAALPVSRFAALCGAVVLFVHPALVAPLAGIDGYASLFSTGLMWIAAYAVWACRERPAIGVLWALAAFVPALGFKEYALGAVPLACLAVLCFSGSMPQALRRALIVGAGLSAAVLGFIILRRCTIPPPEPGQHIGYFILQPVMWIKNAALFAGVLLFPGSSKWVFVSRSPVVLASAGAAMLVFAATLLAGLRRGWTEAAPTRRQDGTRRWIVFAILSAAAASFPAVLVAHVSEMYVSGMIVSLAIVTALAVDGLRRSAPVLRAAAAIALIGAVVWSCFALRSKVADLRAMGDQARDMLQQISALLPADAHDLTIAICYAPQKNPPPKYSVFQFPQEMLIEQPQALWWLRPYRNLSIAFPAPALNEALAHADDFGLIVQWDSAEGRMKPLKKR